MFDILALITGYSSIYSILPNRSVFLRFDKLNLDILGSILFRLLMRVHLSLMNKGRRRTG